MASKTIQSPETLIEESVEEQVHKLWHVILFNDDEHDFEDVIYQVQKATGCSLEQAVFVTWEAHTQGLAVVYEGDIERCIRVEAILRQIDLHAEIWG